MPRMNIEVGKIYQSVAFPHIQRKVLGINDRGIVFYSFINSREPGALWRRTASAVISEFVKVCKPA